MTEERRKKKKRKIKVAGTPAITTGIVPAVSGAVHKVAGAIQNVWSQGQPVTTKKLVVGSTITRAILGIPRELAKPRHPIIITVYYPKDTLRVEGELLYTSLTEGAFVVRHHTSIARPSRWPEMEA